MKKNKILILFLCLTIGVNAQTDSGNLKDDLFDIINKAQPKEVDNYQLPIEWQLSYVNTALDYFFNGDLYYARYYSQFFNYEIVEYTDTSTPNNHEYYIFKEKSEENNYWGTYVFRKTPERPNLILQAPHVKFDTNTGKQAVYSFLETGAKAVFLNGAHRCNSSAISSCDGKTSVCGTYGKYKISDMTHNINSMFQIMTEKVFNNINNSIFIQLHGFKWLSKEAKKAKQEGEEEEEEEEVFFDDPYVIMSNGTQIAPVSTDYIIEISNALLQEDNSLTFGIVHLGYLEKLRAFTNTQGRLINSASNPCNQSVLIPSGRFIHIEQAYGKLRSNQQKWQKMSNALKRVFPNVIISGSSTNNISLYPNPFQNTVTVSNFYYLNPIAKIDVYDTNNNKVLTQNNHANSYNILLDFSSIPGNRFLIKCYSASGEHLKSSWVIRNN